MSAYSRLGDSPSIPSIGTDVVRVTPQECAVATEGKMTVVGDIHGQLQDLFSIFTINGIPCPQNHYIFNGDFVDRGPCGAEVLFTLCAFKVRCVFEARLLI